MGNPVHTGQIDNSPETANRTADFFPISGTNNAVLAEAETPKRQLTVYGLTPSFLSEDGGTATAQGTLQYQLSDVHEELVPYGFLYSPEKIVGARRSSDTSRNGQTVATRVTYNNEETKADVIKAAKAGKIWDSRKRKVEGKHAFFKEPSYPKKRKNRPDVAQDQDEPEPKKARKDQDPDQSTKLNEAEEAEEDKKTKKFVKRELEIEDITQQIQDETEKSVRAVAKEYFGPEVDEVRRERELERVQEATESEMYETLVEQGRNTQTESGMPESPIEQKR